jgi:hypothetical protein
LIRRQYAKNACPFFHLFSFQGAFFLDKADFEKIFVGKEIKPYAEVRVKSFFWHEL